MSKLSNDKKISKIRDFVKYNWWLFSIGIWIAVIAPIFVWFQIQEDNAQIKALIKKNIRSVIVATPDGKVLQVKKEPVKVDSKMFHNYLLQMGKNFIYSKSNLTKAFTYQPQKAMDLYKEVQFLKHNFKTFFGSKNAVLSILKKYFEYLTTDELPEYVSVIDGNIEDFKMLTNNNDDKNTKNNQWQITLKYKVVLNSWLKEKNLTQERIDYVIMKFIGFSDPLKFSTIDNPYGLKISRVLISIPKKRKDNVE
jgi:hypothetical protein